MLSLRGDSESLRQLLSILLDNALKYSDDEGMIELCMDRRGRNLRLSVSNTTLTPIPQEQLAHMFDRFYRGDQSRNSQNGGYGIGLSIAKAVVQAHRGKVSASAWGKRPANCGGAADALAVLLRLNQQHWPHEAAAISHRACSLHPAKTQKRCCGTFAGARLLKRSRSP